MRKFSVLTSLLVLVILGLVSSNFTFSFFSNSGNSTTNLYAAASTFPTPTPSPSPTPPPIAQTLVMNEILPLSSCSSGQTNGQFLELWNGTAGTVNLKDFKLSDGTTTIAVANANTNLPSHAFAILVKSAGVINSCLGDIHNAVDVNLGGSVNLNTGTLQLLDANDNVIDRIKWGIGQVHQPTVNQSVERNPTGLDSALGVNFNSADMVIRATSTPGI